MTSKINIVSKINITPNSWLDDLQTYSLSYNFYDLWNLKKYTTNHFNKIFKKQSNKQYYINDTSSSLTNNIPKSLLPFLEYVNSLGYATFNQIIINWYVNGSDYIGEKFR